MTLSALIDLGADISYIESNLKSLPIDPFTIEVEKTIKCGITAKKLKLSFSEQEPLERSHDHNHSHQNMHSHNHNHSHQHEHSHDYNHSHQHEHSHDHVHVHNHSHGHSHDHVHRKAADIMEMIQKSTLPERVKQRSLAIFDLISHAEGKIHDMDPGEVHLHEVGAMDSIIDIIGVCLALEYLDIEEIYASPVPTGQGKVWMAHGLFPIPAPATAELLKGIPLAELNAKGELTTPTGAGILKALVRHFGPLPAAKIEEIGYGAGEKDFNHPNVLRALILDMPIQEKKKESISVLETQVDDMTGEALGYTMEQLFNAGALDVFYTSIQMKKNRPGILITVLSSFESVKDCENVLLTETTTLGIRHTTWERTILERKFITLETPYGNIRMKQAISGDKLLHQAPEFEDVSKASKQYGIPFHELYQQVLQM